MFTRVLAPLALRRFSTTGARHTYYETLKTALTTDMKAAMRARDAATRTSAKNLLAALQNWQIDHRDSAGDKSEMYGVLAKVEAQLETSIAAFQEAGRQDLAEGEQLELAFVRRHLAATGFKLRQEVEAAAWEYVAPLLAKGASVKEVMASVDWKAAEDAWAAPAAVVRASLGKACKK